MHLLQWLTTYQTTLVPLFLLYGVVLGVYRLFLHPLARFPGPKVAAISRWYEAYYDVVQNGQYTFKIAEMHKKYGPIVRISPFELHINDPAFFNTIYRQEGKWDKYAWNVDAFTAKGATIFTPDHTLHKARREPLNPFFSKSAIFKREEMLHRHLRKLLARISSFAGQQRAINLGAAVQAYTRDVANEFILDKDYNSLSQDFDVSVSRPNPESGHLWRTTKHVRWFGPLLTAIPRMIITRSADKGTKSFFKTITEHLQDTKKLMSKTDDADVGHNLVHAIMTSKLPPSEKDVRRVFEDISTVLGAGTGTTAAALRLILVNLFTNAPLLQRLRDELAHAGLDSSASLPAIKALEQLPFLTSLLMEGLRLSPAIASRMTRLAPDRDIHYDRWTIPAGTPVGMTLILMHTDETIYPNAQKFEPDRWGDAQVRRKLEKSFAPFSKGSRNCVGQHLAWAEMYLIVAVLALRYDFRMEADVDDFLCNSDQFAIGTKSHGFLKTFVTDRGG
ncbi:cytochrome P450 [Nemania diffusa]|nr:cytochrome P450 [Nemania diffusa]